MSLLLCTGMHIGLEKTRLISINRSVSFAIRDSMILTRSAVYDVSGRGVIYDAVDETCVQLFCEGLLVQFLRSVDERT